MTKKKDLALSFKLASIKTEEFAIIEESFKDGERVNLSTSINFGIDKENHILGTTIKFKFDQNETPFLIVAATCAFQIEEKAWESLLDEESVNLIVPEGFASHMAVLTTGTIRGILHEKTNDTEYNHFIVPPINLTELITEDVVLKLNDD